MPVAALLPVPRLLSLQAQQTRAAAMATPLGVLAGLRGVFFVNLGGAALSNQSFKLRRLECSLVGNRRRG